MSLIGKHPRSRTDPKELPTRTIVCGIHTIREALQAGTRRVEARWVAERKEGARIGQLVALAAERGVKIERVSDPCLTEAAGTSDHQGAVAFLASSVLQSLEEVVARAKAQRPAAPLAILDGIKDPRNCGAIIRSAAAFGLGGVVLPRHRAVSLTATVAKAAAGGLEYVAIAEVTNIVQTIDRLKRMDFWVVGGDEAGKISCESFSFPSPLALVFGEEGRGLSPLVRRHCDVLVQIPVRGALRSLNVSVAAAIFFYEAMRSQRLHGATAAVRRPGRSP
jgi:23S rRNA (guanosine2251-2'-O)-methyltransferase